MPISQVRPQIEIRVKSQNTGEKQGLWLIPEQSDHLEPQARAYILALPAKLGANLRCVQFEGLGM